jgi:hypothetical protein
MPFSSCDSRRRHSWLDGGDTPGIDGDRRSGLSGQTHVVAMTKEAS